MKIAKDTVVTIDYTLTDEQGKVMDSSRGQEPLTYLHGAGNLIPGLESQLEGKSKGDEVKISVPPAEAYGERDERKVLTVAREQFRGIDRLEVGMQFAADGGQGEYFVTVTRIDGDMVTVDANHPLAGKTLNFDVRVVDVRQATPDELSHGHVHGPGGHH
ncbi:MAG TPA: peptidylprolyl isomerase [Bacteroidota bacterium]|nr:peptidylprolyl isomerase [Bacteroidota bacterium]